MDPTPLVVAGAWAALCVGVARAGLHRRRPSSPPPAPDPGLTQRHLLADRIPEHLLAADIPDRLPEVERLMAQLADAQMTLTGFDRGRVEARLDALATVRTAMIERARRAALAGNPGAAPLWSGDDERVLAGAQPMTCRHGRTLTACPDCASSLRH